MKKVEHVFIVVAIVVALFGGGVFSLPWVLGAFTKDIRPIDDGDLVPQKIILLDSENAYSDLTMAGRLVSLTEEEKKRVPDLATGKQWNTNVASAILTKNEEALERFSLATNKQFQDIHLSDPKDVSLDLTYPYINDWRTLAQLSIARARLLAKEGRGVDSFVEAMKSIRMGDSIMHGQGTMVHYLIGLGIKDLGMRVLLESMNTASLDRENLKRFIRDFSEFYDNESGLASALKMEYQFQTTIIDKIAEGTFDDAAEFSEIQKLPKTSYYFRPNKTKQLFSQPARNFLAQIQKPCIEISFPEISQPSGIGMYFTENAIGHIMMSISITSNKEIFDKKCQDDLLVGVTQTMLALRLYQSNNGGNPTLLQELVPQYLPAVPFDPYDGQPLRYDASKKILYSVGKDGQDDGGSQGDDWKKMSDPTFEISF